MEIYRTIKETVDELPTAFKIRVANPKESKRIQEHLLKLDYRWQYLTGVNNLDKLILYTDNNKIITCGVYDYVFDEDQRPIVELRDILATQPEIDTESLLSDFLNDNHCFERFADNLDECWYDYMIRESKKPKTIILRAFFWTKDDYLYWYSLNIAWRQYLKQHSL